MAMCMRGYQSQKRSRDFGCQSLNCELNFPLFTIHKGGRKGGRYVASLVML